MSKEIEVNGKTIGENTKITISVKVALWLISAIIVLFSSVFSVAYFDVKKDIRNIKNR